jgi:hypothetical protein
MRYFGLVIEGEVIIGLDEAVIDAVDDEWRKMFYDFKTPEEIAEMVGRCMAVYNVSLDKLDGWADQPPYNARLVSTEWYTTTVVEIPEDKLGL